MSVCQLDFLEEICFHRKCQVGEGVVGYFENSGSFKVDTFNFYSNDQYA